MYPIACPALCVATYNPYEMIALFTKYPKLSLLAFVVILAVSVVGTFTYTDNRAKKKEINRLGDEKEDKIQERDQATTGIKTTNQQLKDSTNVIIQQDAKIIYVPYKERVYIDRNIDTALIILQRARYLVQ